MASHQPGDGKQINLPRPRGAPRNVYLITARAATACAPGQLRQPNTSTSTSASASAYTVLGLLGNGKTATSSSRATVRADRAGVFQSYGKSATAAASAEDRSLLQQQSAPQPDKPSIVHPIAIPSRASSSVTRFAVCRLPPPSWFAGL